MLLSLLLFLTLLLYAGCIALALIGLLSQRTEARWMKFRHSAIQDLKTSVFDLLWASGKVRNIDSPPVDQKFWQSPDVSIVVPFKNEAKNLERLLISLEAQDYKGHYEILLVNDGSTDGYKTIIASRLSNKPLRVIDSVFSAASPLTSKQQALDYGIRGADGDWIALTDADMVLKPGWLSGLMNRAADRPDLVFGHTVIDAPPATGLFGKFQSFQLEVLFAVAYALHRAGIAGSCMGNNILISRKAYVTLGGFDAIGRSIVEDRALLAAFRDKEMIVAATDPFFPSAVTFPCATFNGYRNQLLRWIYGGFTLNSSLSLLALPLVCQILVTPLAAAGVLSMPVAALATANLLITWLFIALGFRAIGSKEKARLFPLYFAALLPETVLVLIALIFRPGVLWKGRPL